LLRQESLRHILASPGYAPGTIAINFTWMEREFNACQTHRSMYPSIFNLRFPVIEPESLKVRHFSTFFCTFWPPLGTPLSHSWKEDSVLVKRLAAYIYIPICLQPFLRHSKLLVENCDIFIPHLCLAAPQGVTPSEFREDPDIHKTRMNGLSCGEESMTIY